MTTRHLCCAVALLGWLGSQAIVSAQQFAEQLPQPMNAGVQEAADSEGEALTRGPVHEAFAEPVNHNPAPGPAIDKQPPEPIEELPPEARPDDPNAQWITGYWIWDDDRNDFLWVSGIWRVPPASLRWVPGYWNQVASGYQRVGGFWAPAAAQEVHYLPPPPQSVEAGPNVPAPSPDYFWVPGCWVWEGGRYLWRSGYWAPVDEELIWVPAHYVWTPRGCVFVAGYWDYQLVRRGVIFAPAYFPPAVYLGPAFVYTPGVIINVQFMTSHFFVRPTCGHYYFGDYYAGGVGIQPWFVFQRTRGWHDPVFVHHRWQYSHRGDDWGKRQQANYQYFALHEDLRPRHTFSDQQKFVQQLNTRVDVNVNKNVVQNVSLGASVKEALAGDAKLPHKLERIPAAQRKQLHEEAAQLRELSHQRVKAEAKSVAGVEGFSKPATDARNLGKMKLPELTGRAAEAARQDKTPRLGPVDVSRSGSTRTTLGQVNPGVDSNRNKATLPELKPDRSTKTTPAPDVGPRNAAGNSGRAMAPSPTGRPQEAVKQPQPEAKQFTPTVPQPKQPDRTPQFGGQPRGQESAPKNQTTVPPRTEQPKFVPQPARKVGPSRGRP